MGNDPFGRAFIDHHLGRETELVFERDDGYSNTSELPHYFREYEAFSPYEKDVLSCAGRRVLDVGCGAGRHSLWLEREGLDVTGVDSSPLALEVCKRRGVQNLVRGEVHSLPFREAHFDTIVLLGNGFGLAGRLEETVDLLRTLHGITSDGAHVLTDCRNPVITREKAHLEYHEANRKRGRPAGEVRIRAKCKSEVSDWFHLLMVTPQDMEEVCGKAGWRVKEFFEDAGPSYGAVLEKARP
jgi:SAM-dependent methyltransferase